MYTTIQNGHVASYGEDLGPKLMPVERNSIIILKLDLETGKWEISMKLENDEQYQSRSGKVRMNLSKYKTGANFFTVCYFEQKFS